MTSRPCIAAFLAVLSACAAPSFQLTPRVGQLSVDGHLGVASGSTAIQSNDLEDGLGLEKDSAVPGARFDADFGAPRVTLAWWSTSVGGDGILQADISQGTTTIGGGIPVSSNLDLDLYSLLVTFDLIPGDNFELGLGLGAQIADLSARVRDPATANEVSVDQVAPIPVLALRAGVCYEPFELSALLSGLKVTYSGDQATFYDLDVAARLRLLGGDSVSGSLAVGWHQVGLDVEYEDQGDQVDANLKLSGPYIGLTLGF